MSFQCSTIGVKFSVSAIKNLLTPALKTHANQYVFDEKEMSENKSPRFFPFKLHTESERCFSGQISYCPKKTLSRSVPLD
jgi:hypothetical protein